MIPKILLAFDMQFWMCASKDNFPSNITPKSFSSEQIFNTDSSSPDFKMYLYLGLLYPICKTWHLFTLKRGPHLKDHSWSLAKSSCKIIEFLVMLKILVSSANIRQKLFMLSAMSFIKLMQGYSLVVYHLTHPRLMKASFLPALFGFCHTENFSSNCVPLLLYHTS